MSISDVQLHEVPAVAVAVVRRQAKPGELARLVPELCGVVWNTLRAQNVRGGSYVAIYLGIEDRVEVGAEIIEPFTEQGEVVRSAIPGGVVASLVHCGPYATLGRAHETLRTWCRQNGYALAGPSWE